ncbi:sialate O-acetylesterase [Aquimarina celericrescens]|uniref:Sialate O-acetylesterase n=1 Tax=Aquimarina celericrescens TaxID=1964542 RepID=A0ABW5B0H1_9FLAO|nr:beta galactosidase jelly roll domain-containing protein [Aquimarina celericrescens]
MSTNPVVLWVLVLFTSITSMAQLKVSKLFADGMVIQRDEEIPVWGWGTKDSKVSITYDHKDFSSKIASDGTWEIKLPKKKAGGPYSLKIQSGNEVIDIKNILVGDVWLCSGQSNMEWTLKNSLNAEIEIRNASNDQIRHFKIPRSYAFTPEQNLRGGEWTSAKDSTLANFTAVGYYFAKELYQTQKIAIGLINSSWGGSRIEPWMRAETLGFKNAKEAFEAAIKAQKDRKEEQLKILKQKLQELPIEELGILDDGNFAYTDPNFDHSSWSAMELPSYWEDQNLQALDGIVWFRKNFKMPDKFVEGSAAEIQLGAIDDTDQVWVNGFNIGGLTQSYYVKRKYTIPKGILKKNNLISIRVEDTGGGGGIYGRPEEMNITFQGKRIPLHGNWKYKVAQVYLAKPDAQINQIPTVLYNKMIHPIHRFPIKGIIWYQGESNSGDQSAFAYRNLFKKMIQDWRLQWHKKELPFLFVQLANYMKAVEQPVKSNWAVTRESQSKALELPNTAQAVIIDIGDAMDIHPRNKQDVGYRLAVAARKISYDEDIVYSGPVYESHEIRENKIVINFDHKGSGLWAKNTDNNQLFEFSIAGRDRKFYPAKAKIEQDQIIVWSEKVINPIAVRYAWADNPDKANFYNKEGLPASPFRTDQWEE